MNRRRLSVVVVTRNALATLPDVVARVRAQNVAAEVELVVVDCASKDGSREFARSRAEHVVDGRLRAARAELWNLGLERASGEVVVLLDTRALPADPRWLSHLVAPFADQKVAAVFARRLPAPDSGLEPEPSPARTVRFSSAGEFDALSPDARRQACAFDPVCAAVRRSEWAQHPFRNLSGAEGFDWARTALRAGAALIHSSSAAVYFGAPVAPLQALLDGARVHRQLNRLLGSGAMTLELPRARTLPRSPEDPAGFREQLEVAAMTAAAPLGALAGEVWARVEARLAGRRAR